MGSSSGSRGLSVELEIEEEIIVLASTVLGRKARAVLCAAALVGSCAGGVVGTPAVVPLQDGESEGSYLVAVVRAVSV